MFLINSCWSRFTVACCQAPLIANVRGHFAEFLNQWSPERLRLLISPTCVSFSTVDNTYFRNFSWMSRLGLLNQRPCPYKSNSGADLPVSHLSVRRGSLLTDPSHLSHRPSIKLLPAQEYWPAAHRLRLSASTKEPANPGRIYLPQETLGFRRAGFSPALSLLIPA